MRWSRASYALVLTRRVSCSLLGRAEGPLCRHRGRRDSGRTPPPGHALVPRDSQRPVYPPRKGDGLGEEAVEPVPRRAVPRRLGQRRVGPHRRAGLAPPAHHRSVSEVRFCLLTVADISATQLTASRTRKSPSSGRATAPRRRASRPARSASSRSATVSCASSSRMAPPRVRRPAPIARFEIGPPA